MKKVIICILFTASLIGFSVLSKAQSNTGPVRSNPTAIVDDILTATKEIKKKAGANGWVFLTKNKATTPYQRSMLQQCKKGKQIIDKVTMKGEKLTDAEAKKFDAQMKTVVEKMDALFIGYNRSKGGSQGECFGSCDSQYPGLGGGHGWNRFWCKASCFKIEVHVGG